MGFGNLPEELSQLPQFLPTYGMGSSGVVAVIIGEALSFVTQGSLMGIAQTTTLTRRPATSAAAVAANAFATDVAGLYTVTVLMSGLTKTYFVYAYPPTYLTQRVNGDQPGASTPAKYLTRNHLAIWTSTITPTQLAALETIPTPNLGVLGAINNIANLGA